MAAEEEVTELVGSLRLEVFSLDAVDVGGGCVAFLGFRRELPRGNEVAGREFALDGETMLLPPWPAGGPMPGRDTWLAAGDGWRNSVGGGSRALPLPFAACDCP